MDPDMDSLLRMFKMRAQAQGIELDDDGAQELAKVFCGAASTVFSAASVSPQLDAALGPSQMLVSHQLAPALLSWKSAVKVGASKTWYKIPSCPDGSCQVTALRQGIDLMFSTKSAVEALGDNKTAEELDWEPVLSGAKGSPNHQDNFSLRMRLVHYYIYPVSNLDIHEEHYGKVTWIKNQDAVQAGEADFQKKLAAWNAEAARKKLVGEDAPPRPEPDVKPEYGERNMTRADFILTEVLEYDDLRRRYGLKDTSSIMSESPEALERRREIARDYMAQMSKDREWGSTPMLRR